MKSLLIIPLLLAAVAMASCDDSNGADATPTATASPPISINQPGPRATVQIPFAISGAANVFEGALSVRVLDASGATLCERAVQATSGTGTAGNWTTTMAFAPPPGPAPADATIRAFSLSAADGSEQNIVLQDIAVSPEPPLIVIEAPGCNASFSKTAPLVASGNALVFEAVLHVDLRRSDGTVVISQMVMSANGTERSPWSTTLDISGPAITPGFYELVAFDFSARDGSPENLFAIPIEVTP